MARNKGHGLVEFSVIDDLQYVSVVINVCVHVTTPYTCGSSRTSGLVCVEAI